MRKSTFFPRMGIITISSLSYRMPTFHMTSFTSYGVCSSYKELLPLIPTILNKLYQIYNATYSPPLRHVIIELCLTIPSRLSTLLPHLPLLIKQIIPALNSNTGTLINLSMRTLEFWCDNLHPDYLHPLFATQDNDGVGYCTLMMALTQHLQPAPYPYGLLCMRLLGKLGGVNRLFLREMVVYVDSKGQGEGMETRRASERGNLCMHCEWQRESSSNDAHYDKSFLLPFPLDRAVDVLRSVSAAPTIHVKDNGNSESVSQGSSPLSSTRIDFSDLLAIDSRTLDLNIYSVQTVEEIKNSQAKSAFAVLRAALASVLDIGEDGRNEKISVCSRKGETNDESLNVPTGSEDGGNDPISRQSKIFTHDFKLICDGLFMASVLECIEDEALVLLKGLGSHIFYFLVSHRANITRIDRDGCPIDPYHEQLKGQSKKYEKYNSQNHINEKLQPLKPFGTFRLSGPLEESDIDPLSFNKALADAFAGATVTKTRTTASVVMHHLIELFLRVKSHVEIASDGNRDAQSTVDLHTGDPPIEQVDSPSKLIDASVFEPSTWGDVFFENLLSTLCQACFSQPWNLRSGIMAGMFDLITRMGLSWSAQYEVEILHTAMFIVKDTPDGIAHASEDAARFFLQVSWFFFGGPSSWKESNAIIVDVLCPMMGDNQRIDNSLAVEDTEPVSVKEASITLILSEIASAKPLVR